MYRFDIRSNKIEKIKKFSGSIVEAKKELLNVAQGAKIDRLTLTKPNQGKVSVLAAVIHGGDYWYFITEQNITT